MEQPSIPPDTTQLPTNGQARSTLLSSNMTLFWRVFVPAFGTVFFTGLLLAFLFTDGDEMATLVPILWIRALVLLIWVGWLYFVWKKLWKLKRVEANDLYVFVTDYWFTARYPWEEVERWEEHQRMGRTIGHLHLRAPGKFGQKISFLASSSLARWMEEHGKNVLKK